MRTLLKILFLLLICFTAKSQAPAPSGFPAPYSAAYYRIGWMYTDSGMILASRDTSVRSKYAGLMFLWQHAGLDSSMWFYNGTRYVRNLNSQDTLPGKILVTKSFLSSQGYLSNLTGLIQQGTNVTITGLGTLVSPFVINASGGGGGGISSLNGLTATTQTFATGSAGADFNISSSGSAHTFNFPTGSASNRGLISTSDWSNFNSKQPQINGTGFVVATGTSISFDNTVYYPNSNPSNFISRTGISATAPILYNNSTGIISADTSSSNTSLASRQYVLNHQTSGTITGAGNLVPLFTTSIVSNTIVFTLSNAAANSILGNNTGSTGPPSYFVPNGTTISGWLGFTPISLTSLSATSPLSYNSGTGAFSIQVANASQNGYLSSTDWNTFNGKQAALSGTGYLNFSGTTPSYLTPTQVTANLNLATSVLQGLAPASGGGTTNFLRADFTWAAPPSGFADPLTTNGDIIARISGSTTRLPQGANGTFLGVSGGALGYYTPGGGGTVTSVATGLWLSGGPITNTGTIIADSASMAAYFPRRKDSIIVFVTPTQANGLFVKQVNSDIGRLPVIQLKVPAVGVSTPTSTVTNYPASSVDSVVHYWGVTNIGTDWGGVLWPMPAAGNDSILITAPFIVVIGNSLWEGHTSLHGRLHPGGASYNPNWLDTAGQISFEMRKYTNMRCYNQAIGGQLLSDIRARVFRDGGGLLAPNSTDSRGNQTLSRRPYMAILEGGINDVYAGRSAQQIEDDYEYLSSWFQSNGIRLVVANIPGDATATQAFLQVISTVNGWLAAGNLDKYGVTLWDFNSAWNDPVYGGDNIHHVSYISDDIHFTKAGYDTITRKMAAAIHFPSITGVIFQNEIGPGGFSGYSRPASITINGNALTITKSTDTLPVNFYIPDSVWIRTTSTTNISGTTNYGFSSIYWYLDNNPTNEVYFTRRTMGGGGSVYGKLATLKMIAENNSNTNNIVDIFHNDATYNVFRLINSASGMALILNGGNSPAILSSANLSVYGGIASNAFLSSTGVTGNRIGALEMGNTAAPNTLGNGIGAINNAMDFQTNAAGDDAFRFNKWSTLSWNFGTSALKKGFIRSSTGFGTMSDSDTLGFVMWTPTINNTSLGKLPGFFGGIYMEPTITALGPGQRLYGVWQTRGDNWLNTLNGKTAIGTNAPKGSAKLDITSKTRGLLPPRMSTGQRDSIGYVGSVTLTNGGSGYTTAPTVSITSSGTGAVINATLSGSAVTALAITDPGEGYKPGTSITIGFSGPGTGATATATISGPDSGLVIFNVTTSTMQFYNGSSWIDMGGSSGVTTVGTFSGSSIANGASISGATITFGQADGTNPGMVSTVAQTFAGLKTMVAPKFTGLTSAGGSDSVLTIDPATNQIHWRYGIFNLNFDNGLTGNGVDSVYLGGTLIQNTNIGGGGFNLSLGTSGSNLGQLDIYSPLINLRGAQSFYGGSPTNANLTVANEGMLYLLPTITANRTITLPSVSNYVGRLLVFTNTNTASGFNWSFASTVINPDASTVTNLINGYTYILQSHGTFGWVVISRTASGSSGVKNYEHTIFAPTTGGTVNTINNQYNIINPAGALATLTVNLPSSPNNNDVVYIKYTQTISAVTYANGTVVDGITAPVAGGLVVLTYDGGTTSWY